MVFKPFKPPLIRKSQPDPKADTTDKAPPAKKQRLSNDGDQISDTRQTTEAHGERKPLLQLRNASNVDENTTHDSGTEEKYYNALWSVFPDPPWLLLTLIGGNSQSKNTKLGTGMGSSLFVVHMPTYRMSRGKIWGG